MRWRLAAVVLAGCAANGQTIAPACAPNSIVADGASLFWIDVCGGSVMALANGAVFPSSIATGQSRAASLTADATHLYWIVYTTDTTAEIRTMAKTSGAVTTLAANESSPDTVPGRLVVDDTNLYWEAAPGALRSVAKAGSQPTTLASSNGLSTPAVGDGYAYWSEGGTLKRRSGDGTVDTIVHDASNEAFTSDLIAAHGKLYFRIVYSIGEGSVGLWSVDATPGAQPAALPMDAHDVWRAPMVLFADRLYWVQHGGVVSMRLDGTDLFDEATLNDGEDATSLAVDASYVYWTDTTGAGAVMGARLQRRPH